MKSIISFDKVMNDDLSKFISAGKDEAKTSGRSTTAAKAMEVEGGRDSTFVFPSHKFAAMGARVNARSMKEFSIDFGNKHFSAVNDKYIKRVLSEAWAGSDLINISEEPLWDIQKVSSNKFIVKRVG